jgi:pyruvate formate lyase activating enzyme
VPLHFTAFHPDFKMRDVPRTPTETVMRAREQALRHGLRHVYTGNVHDQAGQCTYCAGCGKVLVERSGYSLGAYALEGDRCKSCGAVCAGVYAAGGPGKWGPKRRRLVIS